MKKQLASKAKTTKRKTTKPAATTVAKRTKPETAQTEALMFPVSQGKNPINKLLSHITASMNEDTTCCDSDDSLLDVLFRFAQVTLRSQKKTAQNTAETSAQSYQTTKAVRREVVEFLVHNSEDRLVMRDMARAGAEAEFCRRLAFIINNTRSGKGIDDAHARTMKVLPHMRKVCSSLTDLDEQEGAEK